MEYSHWDRFELSENGGIALSQIADYYLGRMGSLDPRHRDHIRLPQDLHRAVTSCAETFVKLFPHALPHRAWAVVFTLFHHCVKYRTVRYHHLLGSCLMLVYPPAITLILIALLEMHSSITKSLCLRYHLFLSSFHL
ncbi:MAG: branched-chain amino acid transport system II carrier protein [Clostridium fessum]